MKTRIIFAAMSLVSLLLMAPDPLVAEGGVYKVNSADTVKSTLLKQMGKRVSLNLQSGVELSGTVTTVSDSLVHLTELSGKDFYDAIVRLDGIQAVIIRVRGN